jgi:hypothetical protein
MVGVAEWDCRSVVDGVWTRGCGSGVWVSEWGWGLPGCGSGVQSGSVGGELADGGDTFSFSVFFFFLKGLTGRPAILGE